MKADPKAVDYTRTGRAFCGKKRITTHQDARRILKIATGNRVLIGLKCRRPSKKSKLTPMTKRTRSEWVNPHKHFTIEDW